MLLATLPTPDHLVIALSSTNRPRKCPMKLHRESRSAINNGGMRRVYDPVMALRQSYLLQA